ncbi:MAG: hypothetical protein GX041_01580 [Clostridiales bacterium]|jgi:aldose 1-epimerase|nr:hypothetical protein [Clostridiales bacterium]
MKELIVLSSEYVEVGVCPHLGAGIVSMRYRLNGRWVDVMRPASNDTVKKGNAGVVSSFIMIPYSNRIENAVLKYRGNTYTLRKNAPDGHAIHGEVRTRPWRTLYQDPGHIDMEFNSRDFQDISWPFPFYARVEYKVSGRELSVRLMLKNTGDHVMPGGMGIHPFFMKKLTPEDDAVILKVPAKGVYPGDTPIPTGRWVDMPEELDFSREKELGSLHIDNCYRVFHAPSVIKWPGSRVTLTLDADDIFKHTIIFSPGNSADFFAIEPVTNCNNGFNMDDRGIEDTGTIHLKPGEAIEGNISIRMEHSEV